MQRAPRPVAKPEAEARPGIGDGPRRWRTDTSGGGSDPAPGALRPGLALRPYLVRPPRGARAARGGGPPGGRARRRGQRRRRPAEGRPPREGRGRSAPPPLLFMGGGVAVGMFFTGCEVASRLPRAPPSFPLPPSFLPPWGRRLGAGKRVEAAEAKAFDPWNPNAIDDGMASPYKTVLGAEAFFTSLRAIVVVPPKRKRPALGGREGGMHCVRVPCDAYSPHEPWNPAPKSVWSPRALRPAPWCVRSETPDNHCLH